MVCKNSCLCFFVLWLKVCRACEQTFPNPRQIKSSRDKTNLKNAVAPSMICICTCSIDTASTSRWRLVPPCRVKATPQPRHFVKTGFEQMHRLVCSRMHESARRSIRPSTCAVLQFISYVVHMCRDDVLSFAFCCCKDERIFFEELCGEKRCRRQGQCLVPSSVSASWIHDMCGLMSQ